MAGNADIQVAGLFDGKMDSKRDGQDEGQTAGITPLRLWELMRRVFRLAADSLEADTPACGEAALRPPHWTRHSHALARGV